ncbi:MAG: YcxB family protein [Oscillospiraceae bacterium]|nr:YcxB family protein [Oscillospiraceae bacterium]
MAEFRYRGRIAHTEKTIQSLYRTRYYAYEKPKVLIRFGIGFALILVTVLTSAPTWAKALLLLVGAWLIVSRDFPSQIQADKVLEERHGVLPVMEYAFAETEFTVSGEGSMKIPYKKLSRLVEDDLYLYLFLTKDSVCMMDRASLKPQKIQEFAVFLAEKTGLSWRREKSFLLMNMTDLRNVFRDLKK